MPIVLMVFLMKNGLVFSLVLALTGLFTRVLQIAISSFFVCLAIFSYNLLSAEILLSEHPVNFRFVYVSGGERIYHNIFSDNLFYRDGLYVGICHQR